MRFEEKTQRQIKAATLKLLGYCERNGWAGFDPYDGLNSRVFQRLPFVQNKLGRLVFTQCMKRLPVNCRRMMRVPREQNAKGLALFAAALFRLSDLEGVDANGTAVALLRRLIALRSPNRAHYCWGYNFDWQSRTLLLPQNEPNIICTTFAGNALLDAYERFRDEAFLAMAASAGEFLWKGLNITRNATGLCFSYTSFDYEQVHNANLLGAAFLARLYYTTAEKIFFNYARSAAQFSVARQAADGSWPYGEGRTQHWIDSFHTGYNLVALQRICHYAPTLDFRGTIEKGLRFYREQFFTSDGRVKYYHDRLYPIDIHCIAQGIITFIELAELDQENFDHALAICRWGLENMQSEDGYFYFRQGRFVKNRISYMRWSQAWMLNALARLTEFMSSPDNAASAAPDQKPGGVAFAKPGVRDGTVNLRLHAKCHL